MWCICHKIDVKIDQKLGDVSDAVILWYFDAWQEWENIPKETYTRFNQSLWSVPAARWSDKILGPAFLLTMLNTTNWLLFIRFSCHQLWRCLHRSAPRRCARPGPGLRLTSDKQCIRKLARVKSGHHSPVKTASLWCFWCIEHRPFVIWILMFHPGCQSCCIVWSVVVLISGGDCGDCGEELSSLINGSGPGLILLISGQWTQFHASS